MIGFQKHPTSNIQRPTSRQRLGSQWMWDVVLLLLLVFLANLAAGQTNLFQQGAKAYDDGDYPAAAKTYDELSRQQPAAGTLLNLGIAEWRRGRTGFAVLAWERALWVDPFNRAARENLRYARKNAQLESPELAWYEAASTWLPVNAWAALAGISLWFAIGVILLPRILHWRRASWQQALAAAGFAVFLLCVPSLVGVQTRTALGFVLEGDTPLRLTPTQDAQTVTLLGPGQPARVERVRGHYVLIRTTYGTGWIGREQFGRVCPE
jgi:hypothetical protein